MLAFELLNEAAGPPLDLDAKLEGERTLAVMGPSGAGKSSLLRGLAGLLTPERGRIALGDESWLDTTAGVSLRPEQRDVGFVFQSYALFPQMSALDNVAYGIRGGRRAERRARAGELLERLGVERSGRMPAPITSQAASASASRSPGRWAATRGCCCWTSRSRRSTRARAAPRRRSSPRSSRGRRSRRSSSPTPSRRPRSSGTRSPSSTAAG